MYLLGVVLKTIARNISVAVVNAPALALFGIQDVFEIPVLSPGNKLRVPFLRELIAPYIVLIQPELVEAAKVI